MRVSRRVLLVTIVALAATAPVSAQSRRSALIAEAQATFEADSVIRLLHAALDPALGAPDSLWAVAGYSLAQVLLERQRADDAALWLRLVARHAPEHPMNRALFPPAVTSAFDQATQTVTGAPDQGDAETVWRWPSQMGTADGTLTVNTSGAPLTVTVEGRGTVSAGTALTLPAGTYTVSASGTDYEPVRVTREVLPGATTDLELHALPLLPASAAASAAATVVRLTFQQAGQQVCRTGYFTTTDGLVLTTAGAVRNAGTITASAGTRTYANVTVLATDPDRDLAVLRVPSEGVATPTATTTSNVRTGDYAWSMSADGCPGETTSRTRLANWTGTTAAASLAPPLPATAAGSALVDQSGLLIGIVTGPERMLPDAFTRDFVDRARAQIAVQVRPSGGGLPWKWLGLGAVAAGVTVAVLGGGGGGDGGPPPPTTGGIIITFPG